MRKIIPITLSALIAASGIGKDARADGYVESVWENISRTYNIPIQVLHSLQGSAFNDLGLRGVSNNRSYNLSENAFKEFLIGNFKDEGRKVNDFLNQGGTEDFWVSRDEITGKVFVNRLMVTPDDVKTRSVEVSSNLGNAISKFASNIDSAESLLYRIREDGAKIEFEVAGGQNPRDINLVNLLRVPFKASISMTDEEVMRFAQISGIKDVLDNYFTALDAGSDGATKFFSESLNNYISGSYSVSGAKADITLSMVSKGRTIYDPTTIHQNVIGNPTGHFDGKVDYDRATGLEGVVVASADTSKAKEKREASGTIEIIVVPEGFSQESEVKEERKRSKTGLVVGSGYNPVRVFGGLQRGNGSFSVTGYGGVSVPSENRESTSRSPITGLGYQHEITETGSEEGIGGFIGGDIAVSAVREYLDIVAGADFGFDRVQFSGAATPRTYSNGRVIERNPDQTFSKVSLEKYLRVHAGPRFKEKFAVLYSHDSRKGHGVQCQYTHPLGGKK